MPLCLILTVYFLMTGCDPEKEFNPADPVLSNTVPHPFNKFHLVTLGGSVTDQASEQRYNLSGVYFAYQPSMSFEGTICREQGGPSSNFGCQGNPSSQNFQILLNQNQNQATFSGSWGPLIEIEGLAADLQGDLNLRFNSTQHDNYEVRLSVLSN